MAVHRLLEPPILTKAGAPPTQQPTPVAGEVAIAQPVAAAAPPEWISTIVPIAIAKNISSRVVVLDHEPTALGGLELPAWARALSPAATYGPINVTSAQLQITTTKWIVIFHFIETVQFVRGSTVLCVLPISSSVFGSATDATISSGSAWLAAQPFVAEAEGCCVGNGDGGRSKGESLIAVDLARLDGDARVSIRGG